MTRKGQHFPDSPPELLITQCVAHSCTACQVYNTQTFIVCSQRHKHCAELSTHLCLWAWAYERYSRVIFRVNVRHWSSLPVIDGFCLFTVNTQTRILSKCQVKGESILSNSFHYFLKVLMVKSASILFRMWVTEDKRINIQFFKYLKEHFFSL